MATRKTVESSQLPPVPVEPRQSSGDFWREQFAKGLTQGQYKAVLDSLPPIVPLSEKVNPAHQRL